MTTQSRQARFHPETAGYQALGDLMGAHPEMAIFRRFRNAATLDLLYRQADLQHTINTWAEISREDKKHSPRPSELDRSQFDFNFAKLQGSERPDDARSGLQWHTWCEISKKLDEYYEKLLKFQKISALATAEKHNLAHLRLFLKTEGQGNRFLEGHEAKLYEELNQEDLTSIAHPDEPDWLERLARGRTINILHFVWGKNSGQTLEVPRLASYTKLKIALKKYPDQAVLKFSRVLYAVLTSLLIASAIGTLNGLQGGFSRLGKIFTHNLLFTVTMALFTHVKPAELFAAAATYGAVLVVFASDSFSSGSS